MLGIIVINPTLDSISEAKVTTQNYDAELGGAAGGIVSVTTKSGGNALHGDAFFFRHSDAFYARNPFNQFQADPVTGRLVPAEVYGQFGGSVSGPIRKDYSFFFLDYQGLRNRLGTSLTQNVPTATVRNTCLAGANGIGTNGNQRMDYTNVAGRLGIAYQATERTVVRAGIGQTYDTVGYFGTLFGSVLSHNLPVQANEDVNKFIGVYQGAPTACRSSGMTSAAPNGRATYNALQTKLDKQFAKGLQSTPTTPGLA